MTEITHTILMILIARFLLFRLCFPILLILPVAGKVKDGAVQKPNVILIITNDQGYGEIGAHGHPVLKTPNLDQLHSESVG